MRISSPQAVGGRRKFSLYSATRACYPLRVMTSVAMPIPPKVSRLINAYVRAFGPYTPQIILISILSVVSSIFEGLGVTAIIPVFSFVGGRGEAGLPTDAISRFIAASYHFVAIPYTFKNLLIGIAVLFVLRIVLIFGIQFISGQIAFGYERDTRRALFSSMLAAQWPYLSRKNMGNLEQLLRSEEHTSELQSLV